MSTDLAVVDGEARWCRHTKAVPLENAMFDYWTVLAESKAELESYQRDWITRIFSATPHRVCPKRHGAAPSAVPPRSAIESRGTA